MWSQSECIFYSDVCHFWGMGDLNAKVLHPSHTENPSLISVPPHAINMEYIIELSRVPLYLP